MNLFFSGQNIFIRHREQMSQNNVLCTNVLYVLSWWTVHRTGNMFYRTRGTNVRPVSNFREHFERTNEMLIDPDNLGSNNKRRQCVNLFCNTYSMYICRHFYLTAALVFTWFIVSVFIVRFCRKWKIYLHFYAIIFNLYDYRISPINSPGGIIFQTSPGRGNYSRGGNYLREGELAFDRPSLRQNTKKYHFVPLFEENLAYGGNLFLASMRLKLILRCFRSGFYKNFCANAQYYWS